MTNRAVPPKRLKLRRRMRGYLRLRKAAVPSPALRTPGTPIAAWPKGFYVLVFLKQLVLLRGGTHPQGSAPSALFKFYFLHVCCFTSSYLPTHPVMIDCETMFRCDIMTPFGCPVVPVEKSTVTVASRLGNAGGTNPQRGLSNRDAIGTRPSQYPNTTTIYKRSALGNTRVQYR